MKTVVSLLNGSKQHGLPFPPELLQRMDSLYAFYHQQWWCYRKMLNHYKCVNALFNGMALLLMAAGMIAGPLLENSTLVACLAAVGTVVKGWNDFKQYRFKVTMSRFAFTTYAKALTELKTHVRGIPLEDLERFLIKMQTLDDTIVDFTPPLPKRCVQDYHGHFVYQPLEALCYVDGCPRPLRPKDYWIHKKPLPPSPTRRRRRRRKRKQRGGALMRRKPRLVDKIAHGMSMFLSGPAPGFGLALGKLGGQALKGITDNVQHYRRQRGGGWWQDFKRNTRQGYKESRDAIKQDKALQRLLTGRPW